MKKKLAMESILSKFVFAALVVLGIGYILVNLAPARLVYYYLTELVSFYEESVAFMILDFITLILLILLGISLFTVGVLNYIRKIGQRIILFCILLASIYLLFLGIIFFYYSPTVYLLDPSYPFPAALKALLLIIGSVITIGSVFSIYIGRLLKYAGSVLGIGGIILTMAQLPFVPGFARPMGLGISVDYFLPVYERFTELSVGIQYLGFWRLGPFMSLTILEGIATGVGVVALVSMLHIKRKRLTHILLSTTTLIYGISVFLGSVGVAWSFWNLLQSEYPIGMTKWVLDTLNFWLFSLIVLACGGILLITCASLGFLQAKKTRGSDS